MKIWVPAIAAAVLMATASTSGAAPLLEEGGAHIHWLQRDNAWYTAVGTVHANGDAVPDVVVAGGDRDAGYAGCAGAPWFALHQATDKVLLGAAKMAVMDGRNGDPLWEVAWRPSGDVVDPVTPDRYHFVSGLSTTDVDGDGARDLIVLRVVRPTDGSDQTQHITSYDPRTGSVEWDVTQPVPAGQVASMAITPFEVFGEPGALLTQLRLVVSFEGGTLDARVLGRNDLVRLEPGERPEVLVELPEELGIAVPTPHGDGYRIIGFPARVTGPPPSLTVDAVAVDVKRHPLTDELIVEDAWTRPNAGGFPAHIAGGTDPAVIVGRPVDARNSVVAAMDVDTGADRWVSQVNAGSTGGTFITADVNKDGVGDVLASPAFGDDPTGLLTGGPFAELHALDGRNGQPLWTTADPLAKFRAFDLKLIDIDGAGDPEIVGSMVAQDGFAACGSTADDPGSVNVWSLATGAERCRLHTDRFAAALGAANLNGAAGDEIVAPTRRGNVYAFTNAEPGCGILGTNPLE